MSVLDPNFEVSISEQWTDSLSLQIFSEKKEHWRHWKNHFQPNRIILRGRWKEKTSFCVKKSFWSFAFEAAENFFHLRHLSLSLSHSLYLLSLTLSHFPLSLSFLSLTLSHFPLHFPLPFSLPHFLSLCLIFIHSNLSLFLSFFFFLFPTHTCPHTCPHTRPHTHPHT